MTPDRCEAAASLLADGHSAAAVARALGVSESTIRRYVKR
ncbi:helix-turn-helix domain-containing protein [Isoptericola sp. b515]